MPNPIISINLLSTLRYTALTLGISYGLIHSLSLRYKYNTQLKHEKLEDEIKREAEGKWNEYYEKQVGVVYDVESKAFDLEKVLLSVGK